MAFELRKYTHPDFTGKKFQDAPNCKKVDGEWLLLEESRMDTVPVCRDGKMYSVEARNLKKGDMVAVGRTECTFCIN